MIVRAMKLVMDSRKKRSTETAFLSHLPCLLLDHSTQFPFSLSVSVSSFGHGVVVRAAANCRKVKRRGNNPYGARGKLRCIHCQESRRKVMISRQVSLILV